MKFYEIRRTIQAPLEEVWNVLSDEKRLLSGDFGFTRFEGTISEGSTIKFWPEVNPSRPFKLKVAGPLLAVIWKSMPDLNRSFEKFAHSLESESVGAHS